VIGPVKNTILIDRKLSNSIFLKPKYCITKSFHIEQEDRGTDLENGRFFGNHKQRSRDIAFG